MWVDESTFFQTRLKKGHHCKSPIDRLKGCLVLSCCCFFHLVTAKFVSHVKRRNARMELQNILTDGTHAVLETYTASCSSAQSANSSSVQTAKSVLHENETYPLLFSSFLFWPQALDHHAGLGRKLSRSFLSSGDTCPSEPGHLLCP